MVEILEQINLVVGNVQTRRAEKHICICSKFLSALRSKKRCKIWQLLAYPLFLGNIFLQKSCELLNFTREYRTNQKQDKLGLTVRIRESLYIDERTNGQAGRQAKSIERQGIRRVHTVRSPYRLDAID